MKSYLTLALGMAALSACSDTPPTAPPAEPVTEDVALSSDLWFGGYRRDIAPIRIYHQNVYVGTDVDAVIAAGAGSSDPTVLFTALLGALQTFDQTNWPERAARMAEEIRAQGPEVIGLNEVSTVSRRGLGAYGLADNTTDFLPVFLQALKARGLAYRVIGQVRNTDVLVPVSIDPATGEVLTAPDGLPLAYAALVDYDVLLARADVGSANVTSKNYQAYLPVMLGPLPVAIKRGYVAADLTVHRSTFRVVTTHPEPRAPVHEVQDAQVAELLGDLAGTTLPVVVAGDLNSEPSDPAGSPHAQMQAAGFVDLWTTRLGPPAEGATCCQQSDLRNRPSALQKRIDYVWIRPDAGRRLATSIASVFGDRARDRTASGLWPSDHGGIFAGALLVPSSLAHR